MYFRGQRRMFISIRACSFRVWEKHSTKCHIIISKVNSVIQLALSTSSPWCGSAGFDLHHYQKSINAIVLKIASTISFLLQYNPLLPKYQRMTSQVGHKPSKRSNHCHENSSFHCYSEKKAFPYVQLTQTATMHSNVASDLTVRYEVDMMINDVSLCDLLLFGSLTLNSPASREQTIRHPYWPLFNIF